MKCYECQNECSRNHGNLSMHDDFIGSYTVNDVDFCKCDSCHEHFFSPKTLKRIDEARETQLKDLLQSYPISSFLDQSEAWRLLGVSRQAFHKNVRIKNGFIYNVTLGTRRYYLRESVDLFKQIGDGRFKLSDTSSEYLLADANTIVESVNAIYFEDKLKQRPPQYIKTTLTTEVKNE